MKKNTTKADILYTDKVEEFTITVKKKETDEIVANVSGYLPHVSCVPSTLYTAQEASEKQLAFVVKHIYDVIGKFINHPDLRDDFIIQLLVMISESNLLLAFTEAQEKMDQRKKESKELKLTLNDLKETCDEIMKQLKSLGMLEDRTVLEDEVLGHFENSGINVDDVRAILKKNKSKTTKSKTNFSRGSSRLQ